MMKLFDLAPAITPHKAPRTRVFKWKHVPPLACLFALYFGPKLWRARQERHEASEDTRPSTHAFRWSDIIPSAKLEFQDCHDNLQCARLEVPLDYSEPDAFPRVALAVIRRPAKVPVTSAFYGGAVITNPGGPGGSRVQQQLMMGGYLQDLYDAEREPKSALITDRYFDVVSFDPRGINHTTPTISCFPDNASRERWNLQWEAEGILGSSNHSLRMNWRRATALAEGCSRMLSTNGTHALAEHMNTTPIAADVMSLVEALGEWRQREAQRLIAAGSVSDSEATEFSRLAWQKGRERLQYHGFSWGTILGSTIAAMYPARIERMVLDGVVDTDDYYGGTWKQNLADTDKILDQFMHLCHEAGPSRCVFWRQGGPNAISDAYEQLLVDIQDDPLAVPGTQSRGPEVITWTDVKLLVKDAVYQPLHGFQAMAEMMQDVTHGNGSRFADYKHFHRKTLCHTSTPCEVPFSHECILPGWSPFDALPAILCTDAEDAGAFTESDFRSYWEDLRNQSRAMGDYWAATRLTCAAWQATAKWRFGGPFTGNTSHPLLYIGNTYDTVTPFRNAMKMAASFPGSGLLRQDTAGHCSFTSPSLCTGKAVRRYFQEGLVPEPGAVCQTDSKPFEMSTGLPEAARTADHMLLQTMVEASRAFGTTYAVEMKT
ncbi:hypothetical protein LTR85_004534 [Meristemomyces frigidus]|nr:hypothetical protein LTR85_004534 [Meristemomyces frigidus]